MRSIVGHSVGLTALLTVLCAGSWGSAAELPDDTEPLFRVGMPDGRAAEFALTGPGQGYTKFPERFPGDVVYSVGQSKPSDWPYIHPAPRDKWAGGRSHTFTICFAADRDWDVPLFLVIGMAGGTPSGMSEVVVAVGQTALPPQEAPAGDPRVCFHPREQGTVESMVFEVPAGLVKKGENRVSIRLDHASWILYDYVALTMENKPLDLVIPKPPDLLAEFSAGPMAGIDEIVFAARALGKDPHWYANFGYTWEKSGWPTYGHGGRLVRLNLKTGSATVLLDDPVGGVRDPVVDYAGKKILFSYRQGDSPNYLLCEINADGSGLRQLTDGPFDDIEPVYLPDGRILFVSSRCQRCVNCHTSDVAVLYCCEADGSKIRALSANTEHDNTPWVLPSGQLLYTRWEYVDRNQVSFHHLWVSSQDGFRQSIFFGNMHPGTTMIDAKGIPGSRKVVASFSPGHGRREHIGVITVVDPRNGPDDQASTTPISKTADFRDPWAFSQDAFMAAQGTRIELLDSAGNTQTIYELTKSDVEAGLECHEPRPLCARPREPILPNGVDESQATGRVLLTDIYEGRDMASVPKGQIKKLLVLESLPKPMNYTGGMEPISYGGTFNLERILGTIPVEPDGSAYAELPALKGLFFVALDKDNLSVKRMRSFMSVMPGETTSCVGCHEHRTLTPAYRASELAALRRSPSQITPITGVPEIFDYPRHVQPILDAHCVECHDYDQRAGGVILTGDRGPMFSISYYSLVALDLISDGRNGKGTRAVRSIGSSASRLMNFVDGSHYDAKLSDHEKKMVRLWIDSGAVYPGTYAALGTGMIGGFEIVDRSIRLDRSDTEWPSMKASMATIERRCSGCHAESTALPRSPSEIVGPGSWGGAFKGSGPWIDLQPNDVRRRFSRHLFYNLTRPEKSLLLLAPLSKPAGGLELCSEPVFEGTDDPDYQTILKAVRDTRTELERIKRFDMPGFVPRPEYVQRMQRYGILPADLSDDAPIDVYATDRAYWEALWHRAMAVYGQSKTPMFRRSRTTSTPTGREYHGQ